MKMKNKKEEQKRKKQQHRKALKEAKRKKRGEAPDLNRAKAEKTEKEKFLIVCEGENTEPSYFKKFKLTTATIKAVGEGYNTISLVRQAEKLAEKDDYDQVWCVFDKDNFPAENFNNAIYMAEEMGFHVAYSNQAFEYWLILHFEDHQGGAMHRDDYGVKLNSYLKAFGTEYDTDSKEITDKIFNILLSKQNGESRQTLAKGRAKKILKHHEGTPPATAESSTTVFKLIGELEKYG